MSQGPAILQPAGSSRPQRRTEDIANHIERINGQLIVECEALEQFTDNELGYVTRDSGEAAPDAPPRPGALGSIEDQLDQTSRLLTRLAESRERLDQI